MSLSCVFQVRLCNFKATGLHTTPNASPPFCVRGNFDGRAFNSEYFHSATMAPIWALDTNFEYQCPTVDNLRSKFLVLECYGGERFLGMSRVDLFSLATGPTNVELSIKEGTKMNGVIAFDARFEQMTSCQVQISRLQLKSIGSRGYEGAPNPYLSYGLALTGNDLESAVASDTESPSWEQLPSMHFRGTFQQLIDQQIRFTLKHSRNGFTAGINDPNLAAFDLALSSLPVEFGRDSAVPFREMVHSLPNYPFPFSSELTGLIEFRNLPKVVQLKGGVLTDEGVVGGVSPAVTANGSGVGTTAAAPQHNTSATILPELAKPRPQTNSGLVSPHRSHLASSAAAVPSMSLDQPAASHLHHGTTVSQMPSQLPSSGYVPSPSGGLDVEMLSQVVERQENLLTTVQERLRQISRRRGEIAHEIANTKNREEEQIEASTHQRETMLADVKMAQAEKERLEALLKSIALRREQEMEASSQMAADRERSRRAIEAEQNEVHLLQERVTELRAEMTRHLEEEELRYAQRVREAEEAKRRAQRDAEDLAALEAKLQNAESRIGRSQYTTSPRRY